jgi:hypothetical protein
MCVGLGMCGVLGGCECALVRMRGQDGVCFRCGLGRLRWLHALRVCMWLCQSGEQLHR